jgi:protein-glutamine gamma-glutamyltransferase
MVPIRLLLNILAVAISVLGVAPVYAYLDVVPRIAFPLALLAVLVMEYRGMRPLRGALPTLAAVIIFLRYFFQFSSDNLLEPAANIIVALLAIRVLGEQIPRNYLQVYALALFSLAASSLFSLSALFLVYLVLLILCIAVSLVMLTFFSEDQRLCLSRRGVRRVTVAALVMPAVSLPLVILFFIVMPRPQFPLLDFLATSGEGKTGLSERLEPGAVGRVNAVQTAVMRVESEPLDKQDLYWRGIVLNTPQGQAWVRNAVNEQNFVRPDSGRLVQQTVFAEPAGGPHLPVLDAPLRVSGVRAGEAADLVFRRRQQSGRVRYDSVSVLTKAIQVRGGIDRQFYLRLPAHVSPRIAGLARSIAVRAKTDRERLSLLEEHYRTGGYRYSTKNLPQTADPLETFLFGGKTGHCEFFATSFMVLLRAAGVPARLVGGYYGGDYNELGGYYLVTEAMAHVWVEVYLDGVGWVRRDPSGYAANYTAGGGATAKTFLARLRMVSDSLNYFWNRAIISYDLEKQVRVFQAANATVRGVSLTPRQQWLLVALLGIAAGWWGFSRYGAPLARQSRTARLARAFRRRVARRYPGVELTPATGMMELAERTDNGSIREFSELFSSAAYRDRPLSAAEFRRLRQLIKDI